VREAADGRARQAASGPRACRGGRPDAQVGRLRVARRARAWHERRAMLPPAPLDPHATPPRRLAALPAVSRALLVAVTLAGLGLRLWHQAGRPFVGDEVGTLRYVRESYVFLLTHFRDPWLSMNVYLAAAKALLAAAGGSTWVLVVPSIVASTAVIPATEAVALRVADATVALAAAALVATNPYLVEQGVVIRSYALELACALGALIAVLDWARAPALRAGTSTAVWLAAAVLWNANALYLVPAIALVATLPLGQPLAPAGVRRRAATTLAVPSLVALVVVALAYAPVAADMRAVRANWSAPAPTAMSWLAWVATAWFGRGWAGVPVLALLAVGAWRALDARTPLRALLAVAAVPAILCSWTGLSHYPWGVARFLVIVLPPLLVVLAAGAHVVGRRPWGAALAVAAVVACWVPQLGALAREQRDRPWPAVATWLRERIGPGTVVVCVDYAQELPPLTLEPLLGDASAAVQDVSALLAPAVPATTRRLLVVNPHVPLATTATRRRFGGVQVVDYGRGDPAALAGAFAADLERTTAGRVDGELAGHYATLLAVVRARGGTDGDGRLTRLFYLSLQRTRRMRFVPPQQLPHLAG
jgi:hypothetical protein